MAEQTKMVTIVLRDGWDVSTPTVEVLWECPTCGGPMGEAIHGHNFCDNDDWYFCNRWSNPCGHVAKYHDLKMKQEDGNWITWNEMQAAKK